MDRRRSVGTPLLVYGTVLGLASSIPVCFLEEPANRSAEKHGESCRVSRKSRYEKSRILSGIRLDSQASRYAKTGYTSLKYHQVVISAPPWLAKWQLCRSDGVYCSRMPLSHSGFFCNIHSGGGNVRLEPSIASDSHPMKVLHDFQGLAIRLTNERLAIFWSIRRCLEWSR